MKPADSHNPIAALLDESVRSQPAGTFAAKVTLGYPDGNPKTAVGAARLPLDLVPPIAMQHLAAAFKDGGAKYGPFNWREQQVSSTVYYAAAMRHLFAWFDGEDFADDSGVHHLAHAMACMAIVLDAESVGMLNDNRPTAGKAADMQNDYALST